MSLKGGLSGTEIRNAIKSNNLLRYVEDGTISTEQYHRILKIYGVVPSGKNPSRDVRLPKQHYKRKSLMKVLRNVLAVVVGLISYIFIEVIATYIFALLLKIPVLSFLMTGYIPVDIFLTVSVSSSAALTTAHIIRLISSYKSVNYSAIIVFLILLSLYLVSFFNHIATTGFTLLKLELVLITAGFMVVGCFSATEKD